jgi:hypothetical protein
VLDESGNDRDGGRPRAPHGWGDRHRSSEFASAIARIANDDHKHRAVRARGRRHGGNGCSSAASSAPAVSTTPSDSGSITGGTIVAEPSADPGVLRVRPLAESHVKDLASGDWSDATARAMERTSAAIWKPRVTLAPIAARPIAPSWIEYVLRRRLRPRPIQGRGRRVERVRQRQPCSSPSTSIWRTTTSS